jgi:hypothetical protein
MNTPDHVVARQLPARGRSHKPSQRQPRLSCVSAFQCIEHALAWNAAANCGWARRKYEQLFMESLRADTADCYSNQLRKYPVTLWLPRSSLQSMPALSAASARSKPAAPKAGYCICNNMVTLCCCYKGISPCCWSNQCCTYAMHVRGAASARQCKLRCHSPVALPAAMHYIRYAVILRSWCIVTG